MATCLPAKAKVFEFKVGDTVVLGCTAKGSDGNPYPLTSVTIASQIRGFDGTLVCQMQVIVVNIALGTYELRAPNDAPFVPGDYKIDVQYTIPSPSGDVIRSTETFYVRMIEDVTQP